MFKRAKHRRDNTKDTWRVGRWDDFRGGQTSHTDAATHCAAGSNESQASKPTVPFVQSTSSPFSLAMSPWLPPKPIATYLMGLLNGLHRGSPVFVVGSCFRLRFAAPRRREENGRRCDAALAFAGQPRRGRLVCATRRSWPPYLPVESVGR